NKRKTRPHREENMTHFSDSGDIAHAPSGHIDRVPPGSGPAVRALTVDDITLALAAGLRDFRAAPTFGLAIGGLFALGGIGTPALQALATRHVDPTRQGQLQGVIASAVSLASIVAPM
ncbi:hypothetical protein J8J27_24055, partial [Mycobacterium tuberculosis]|nr:hypothetical protein [Mycobacterium tuberculosis]